MDWQWLGAYLSPWAREDPDERVLLFETFTGDEPALWHWFKKQRPDVILSQFPDVLEIFRSHGVRVPADCGFILLERPDDVPDIAGVRHDFEQVGANAVDLLDEQLPRNERGVPAKPKIVITEGTRVNKPTVRPRKPSSGITAYS